MTLAEAKATKLETLAAKYRALGAIEAAEETEEFARIYRTAATRAESTPEQP